MQSKLAASMMLVEQHLGLGAVCELHRRAGFLSEANTAPWPIASATLAATVVIMMNRIFKVRSNWLGVGFE